MMVRNVCAVEEAAEAAWSARAACLTCQFRLIALQRNTSTTSALPAHSLEARSLRVQVITAETYCPQYACPAT